MYLINYSWCAMKKIDWVVPRVIMLTRRLSDIVGSAVFVTLLCHSDEV